MRSKSSRLFRQAPLLVIGCAILLVGTLLAQSDSSAQQAQLVSKIPRPDHVVIVIEENKAYKQIIGNMAAQYINRLASEGALFIQSFAVAHPSQPNYLALFSGSTHGVPDNQCLRTLPGDNLASELRKKGLSFGIYSEHYQRKHNPAVNWQGVNIPPEMNMPFSMFPSEYSKLPTVSIVVPNQLNDMHDGETRDAIIRGDRWLMQNLDSYIQWAKTNNSLLIVTWDEDDDSSNNHIATIFVGPRIKPGRYTDRINHYDVLRTIEEMYGLSLLGRTKDAKPIANIWRETTAQYK